MNTPKCVSCGHSQASHDLEHGFCYAGPPRCECDGFLEAVAASERNKFSLVELQQAVKDFCMAEPQLWCTCGGIFGFLDFLESIPSKGTE